MSLQNTLVDVVIPTYGQAELLRRCLQALPLVRGDLRVNVVEDGSPQQKEVRQVCSEFPGVRFFKHDQNYGFAAACNKGAGRGGAALILFLNSDCFLAPDAIDEMLKEMDDPRTAVVGALLTFPEGGRMGPAGKVQHAGMCFDITGKPFHIFLSWDPAHPRVNRRREMNCVTGACLMTRRRVWNAVGGFQGVYGRGTYEDVEYCLQVRALGLNVVFQPKVRGEHFVGSSGMADGKGFPLKQNFEVFKLRNKPNIVWDEFLFW